MTELVQQTLILVNSLTEQAKELNTTGVKRSTLSFTHYFV